MTSKTYASKKELDAEIDRLLAAHAEYVAAQARLFPAETIIAAVAVAHGMLVSDLRSVKRDHRTSYARHHAVWELRRRRLDLRMQDIADLLDREHHTTIVHSYQQFCKAVSHGQFVAERKRVKQTLEGDK